MVLTLAVALHAYPQAKFPSQPASHIVVRAARVLDVRKGTYLENASVLIEGDRVKEVGPRVVESHAPSDAKLIDLGSATVLPGLIDCHTHLMARFADTPDGYLLGLATKSEAFRALEGAADARDTLLAGFTSVRDVENEGSGYADVALRDAINTGLVEGPRMQVATRGIAAVGQYNPFGVSPDLTDFPTGAQMISGPEEARRAVREQIGHGADLIKVYADWDTPTLTVDELRVVVEEAHKLGRKVAAHATTPQGIRNAVNAGVDSIEHGHEADRGAIELIGEKGIFLVPTLGVIDLIFEQTQNELMSPERRQRREKFMRGLQEELQTAMSLHVKIASGFDPSEVGRHGKNALELAAMVKRGMSPADAIRAATVNAAELMGWQEKVGALEPGKYADLIAVEGDPLAGISSLQQVKFVMKGGEVVKDELHH